MKLDHSTIIARPMVTTSPLDVLTNREFEVFQRIGQGETTAQIAKHLRLRPKTVAVHYDNIRRKLKLAKWKEGLDELQPGSLLHDYSLKTFPPLLVETRARDISRGDVEEWANQWAKEVKPRIFHTHPSTVNLVKDYAKNVLGIMERKRVSLAVKTATVRKSTPVPPRLERFKALIAYVGESIRATLW